MLILICCCIMDLCKEREGERERAREPVRELKTSGLRSTSGKRGWSVDGGHGLGSQIAKGSHGTKLPHVPEITYASRC